MKKLVMMTPESVFSGVVKCGMAELVDSLANSLSGDYAVTIVCIDGNGVMARAASGMRSIGEDVRTCRFSCVDYYLIRQNMWPQKAIEIIDKLEPDIFHNLAQPEYLDMLKTRPPKAIYTFDGKDILRGKEEILRVYDAVATSSIAFAKELVDEGGKLSKVLSEINFRGVTPGILDTVLSPEKGLLISAKYSKENMDGKNICKQRLLQTYGIPGDPAVYLMMCRLVPEKGIDSVLDVIPQITENGDVLIVVGKGEARYANALRKYKHTDGVVFVDRWASPAQSAPLTSGADFFLQPSRTEPGGIMPLTASRYGAIPIITLAGGLADSFHDGNAVLVKEDGLAEAIRQSRVMYEDKDALRRMREVCMSQDFSWRSRKAGYIELYEAP